MKRFLFILLVFFTFSAKADASFLDVSDNSEYYQSIQTLADLEVIHGYPDGLFRPDQTVTRAELLKMAYLARTISDSNYSSADLDVILDQVEDLNCFDDLSESDWFAPMVCLAKEEGVIEGYPDGEFKGENTVNIAEAAKILVESGGDAEFEGDFPHWASPYFGAFLKALPQSFVQPDQPVTRAQAAEAVWRFFVADSVDLAEKTSTLMVWDPVALQFLALDYIGSIDHVHYAKSDESVYVVYEFNWSAKLMPDADPHTFKIKMSEISFLHKGESLVWNLKLPLDDNVLYNGPNYVGGSSGQSFDFFEGAFESSGDDYYDFYGHDAHHIYKLRCFYERCTIVRKFESSHAENFDSFEYLGSGVSRTDEFIYVDAKLQEKVDVTTFEYLGDGYYKDKNAVYFKGDMISEDVNEFEHVPFETSYACPSPFSKDSQHVYIYGEASQVLDPDTFQVFQEYGLFYGDAKGVYKLTLEAKSPPCTADSPLFLTDDVSGFEALGSNYFLSDNVVYYVYDGGYFLPTSADPETFKAYEVDESNQYNTEMNRLIGSFGRDADSVFYREKAIKEWDLETFDYFLPIAMPGDYMPIEWSDKNGSYDWSEINELYLSN